MTRVVRSRQHRDQTTDLKAMLALVARTSRQQLDDASEKLELAATSVAIATEVLERMRQAMGQISELHGPVPSASQGPYCVRCVEPWPCGTERAVQWGRNG